MTETELANFYQTINDSLLENIDKRVNSFRLTTGFNSVTLLVENIASIDLMPNENVVHKAGNANILSKM